MRMPPDMRKLAWQNLERAIQQRAGKKDRRFCLRGRWKRFVRRQDGLTIFAVDGSWVRSNLCVYFGHGGHGLVHEFIPPDEIWIATHHYDEGSSLVRCGCKTENKNQHVS